MEIKIKCPNCRQKYDVDESFIGHWMTCQVCGAKFCLEDRKTRCMSCNQWFNVQDYDGATKCPHCGQTTGKHTPEEIAGWDAAAEKKRKKARWENRKLYLQGGVMCVVLGLIVWGLVACFHSCRETIRENEALKLEEGDIRRAKELCEKKIKSVLVAPGTAKIAYEREEYRGDCLYAFSGYIDSQNGFGAMIRSQFAAVISYAPEKREYHVEAFDISQ